MYNERRSKRAAYRTLPDETAYRTLSNPDGVSHAIGRGSLLIIRSINEAYNEKIQTDGVLNPSDETAY